MDITKKLAIKKIARIRDEAAKKYLEVVEFSVSLTDLGRLELFPSVVNDTKAFEKNLRDAGAILPKDNEELKKLLSSVAKLDAPEEWIYKARTGWTRDKAAFVLVDRIIGNSKSKIIGVNRSTAIDDHSGRLSNKGSWRSWRNTVAEQASFSSILMFCICVALAAPLLAIVNRPSFAICLFGRTRVGETIATLVGASIIGIARTAEMITWNITDARFEERRSEFNDALLPIDDLSNMRDSDKKKYQRIRDLTYRTSQGWSTARHSSFTAAHGGVHPSLRGITLTSSEQSIRDLARSVNLDRQHGEALRLIDLPAVFDGLDHIFDRLPDNFDRSNLQTWKMDAFKKIADGCKKNHGNAFRKYIKALISDRARLKNYAQAKIELFVRHVADEHDGDVARDVAERFGLIYAGGCVGIRCHLLSWGKPELLEAVAKCYINARDLLPDDGVAIRQGITALRKKLRELPRAFEKAVEKTDFKQLDGYRKRRKNRYVIKREAFNAIFNSSNQRALVIKWLLQQRRITIAIPRATAGATSSTPKGQFLWPDGKRRRSFEIQWPRKTRDQAAIRGTRTR